MSDAWQVLAFLAVSVGAAPVHKGDNHVMSVKSTEKKESLAVSQKALMSSNFVQVMSAAECSSYQAGECHSFCDDTSAWETEPTWEQKCVSSFPCCSSCSQCKEYGSVECANMEDKWEPGWADTPEDACKDWSEDDEWGALASFSTLTEACESEWALTYCAKTCACHDEPPAKPPNPPPAPTCSTSTNSWTPDWANGDADVACEQWLTGDDSWGAIAGHGSKYKACGEAWGQTYCTKVCACYCDQYEHGCID